MGFFVTYKKGRVLGNLHQQQCRGEMNEYHHPDRLGTRMVTDPATNTLYLQSTLPFGTAMPSESTGFSNQVFTSYDRSPIAVLDYAVNRSYSSGQGRFSTPDPIGMASVNFIVPQSLNLYSYVDNDPVNNTDPSGLFFGLFKKIFKGIGKVLSAIGKAVSRVVDNRWVRIGVFVASFLVPVLSPAVAKIVSFGLKVYNAVADVAASMQLTGTLLQGQVGDLAQHWESGLSVRRSLQSLTVC